MGFYMDGKGDTGGLLRGAELSNQVTFWILCQPPPSRFSNWWSLPYWHVTTPPSSSSFLF